VTAPVRIRQADMERAVKAARAVAPDARIRFDLRNQCIEIILSEPPANDAGADEWTDDD
jgi:hypothetical protein